MNSQAWPTMIPRLSLLPVVPGHMVARFVAEPGLNIQEGQQVCVAVLKLVLVGYSFGAAEVVDEDPFDVADTAGFAVLDCMVYYLGELAEVVEEDWHWAADMRDTS